MYLPSCMFFLAMVPSVYPQLLTVRGNSDPGKCAKNNHGQLILVKDRENEDTILVCTESNGVFSWKTTEGSKPPGEYFNPGYDCMDILNKNPKAKDGFYWVNYHDAKPKNVWCDMTTDGGGYMLIGRLNNTVTFDVPSSNKTVDPFGEPHWTSSFGDVAVLDFRVQVATSDDFKATKAHWSFRLKSKRPLKDLLIHNRGGCSQMPGIGDIAYVKDLQTEKIVTRNFQCSKFGVYSHPLAKVGWTMMNFCFTQPCPNGFAYHYRIPILIAYSGGFSFQVQGSNTSAAGSMTAFFGCNEDKCCACYGAVGGEGNYCGDKCQTKNGTLTKNAKAWFWIRSSPSEKVWEKCMEYKMEDVKGDIVWYKITENREIPTKGRCVKNEALLNDGIVVVPDETLVEKIPPIAGLVAYRKDNKELYLRTNQTWSVIAQEHKLAQLERKLSSTIGQIQEELEETRNLTVEARFYPVPSYDNEEGETLPQENFLQASLSL